MQTLSVERLVGQVLGSYRVDQLLGRGRLNAVFLARNMVTQAQGALTLFMIPDSFSSDAHTRFLQRFHKASSALVALRHDHILPVYEGGEYIGYPYLVTPYMTNGSLADIMKRKGRLPHERVRDILEQVVAGLEHAHSKGIIHGTLKPANIVLSAQRTILVAGFGLMHIQQMRGVERSDQPYGHLLSIANTLLVAPEYIAPEIVEGQSIDKRSDVYALGAILFELLSGQPPFIGSDPLAIIKQHVEGDVPSLRALCPDVPVALESVVNQALARDPGRRFQRASELAEAFDQVSRGATGPLRGLEERLKPSSVQPAESFLQEKPSESFITTKNWQFTPPIVTGKVPAMKPAARQETMPAASTQFRPQTRDTDRRPVRPPAVAENTPVMKAPARPSARSAPEKMPAVESQEMWSDPGTIQTEDIRFSSPLPTVPSRQRRRETEITEDIQFSSPLPTMPSRQRRSEAWEDERQALGSLPDTSPRQRKAEMWEDERQASAPQPRQRRQEAWEDERQASAPQPRQRRQEAEATDEWWRQSAAFEPEFPPGFDDPWSPAPMTGTLSGTRPLSRKKSARKVSRRNVVALLATGGVAAAIGVVAVNNSRLMQMATQAMQTPAANNGTTTASTGTQNQNGGQAANVIGTTTIAANSYANFTNPGDKKDSVLVHLANGNFVAYERACTHVGVNVNYDPATQLLVCPAHGAIFDPTKNAAVVQGPNGSAASTIRPLAKVGIKVNGDGTITTV